MRTIKLKLWDEFKANCSDKCKPCRNSTCKYLQFDMSNEKEVREFLKLYNKPYNLNYYHPCTRVEPYNPTELRIMSPSRGKLID